MKHIFSLLLSLLFLQSLAAEETFFINSSKEAAVEDVHAFSGKHFVASYLDCNPKAIGDLNGLLDAMDEAVKASGASILNRTFHIFPPNGLTAVYLLSESHASIHTYPEYGACFVDLFTCGENCSSEKFDRLMCDYLQPGQTNVRKFARSETTEDIPLKSSPQG